MYIVYNANPKLIEISYTDIQLSTVKTNGGYLNTH
jgi:hypothetical protein